MLNILSCLRESKLVNPSAVAMSQSHSLQAQGSEIQSVQICLTP